jgi:membrane-associated phospholipid phosphatase
MGDMSETLQYLYRLDQDLSARARLKPGHGNGWRAAVILAHSGDSWLWGSATGLVWLLSFGKQPLHAFSAVIAISIIVQALLVFALKQWIRRERPRGDWGAIYRSIDPHSFPSGHATRAVLLAFLTLALGPAWFGWLLVAWAPLVCIARVLTGVHYISDILGGIALGLLMGLGMVAVSPLLAAWFPFLFY